MFTLAGFYESQDAAGAWVAVAALTDQVLRSSGDDLYVPGGLNNIIFAAAGIGSGGVGYARISSPSLRGLSKHVIAPVNGNADADAEPEVVPAYQDLRFSPIPLLAQEILGAEINTDTTAAAAQWVLVAFAPGPVELATGRIFSVRASGSTTLTADAWTLVPLTFDEDLPAGHYQVVGARFYSAGAVAGRLVLIGSTMRPGCLGCDAFDDLDWPPQRNGGLGIWGEFDDQDLPSAEFLSISADTAEVVFLDLIRTGDRQTAPMP